MKYSNNTLSTSATAASPKSVPSGLRRKRGRLWERQSEIRRLNALVDTHSRQAEILDVLPLSPEVRVEQSTDHGLGKGREGVGATGHSMPWWQETGCRCSISKEHHHLYLPPSGSRDTVLLYEVSARVKNQKTMSVRRMVLSGDSVTTAASPSCEGMGTNTTTTTFGACAMIC